MGAIETKPSMVMILRPNKAFLRPCDSSYGKVATELQCIMVGQEVYIKPSRCCDEDVLCITEDHGVHLLTTDQPEVVVAPRTTRLASASHANVVYPSQPRHAVDEGIQSRLAFTQRSSTT